MGVGFVTVGLFVTVADLRMLLTTAHLLIGMGTVYQGKHRGVGMGGDGEDIAFPALITGGNGDGDNQR
ncbi:hypothetical protein AI27_05560 [Sphingomonas sp. BHC-A]|uniref:Uncharacterized protein n=1 Tax=Sphingobium indicum (strain DSM 16412 / CCM 7286 / MTCC 6364 / B90A) TaxID=861109 RepID=A0A1L5BMH2_SPHIB|nr:hypothetical protein SIDU_05725 [Sphingobium indicum B90A]KEY99276.1 hypothetical protein AI27_05560 [Sphingomonas sp. BHC-A]